MFVSTAGLCLVLNIFKVCWFFPERPISQRLHQCEIDIGDAKGDIKGMLYHHVASHLLGAYLKFFCIKVRALPLIMMVS